MKTKTILFCWLVLVLSSCTNPSNDGLVNNMNWQGLIWMNVEDRLNIPVVNPMDCIDGVCIEEYIQKTQNSWLRNCVTANISEHPQISEKMNLNGIFTQEERAGIDALYKECLHYQSVNSEDWTTTWSGTLTTTTSSGSSEEKYPIFSDFVWTAAWVFAGAYIANQLLTYTKWDYRPIHPNNINAYYTSWKYYKEDEEKKWSSGSNTFVYPYAALRNKIDEAKAPQKQGLNAVSNQYKNTTFNVANSKTFSDLQTNKSSWKYSLGNAGKSWSAVSNSYKWGWTTTPAGSKSGISNGGSKWSSSLW